MAKKEPKSFIAQERAWEEFTTQPNEATFKAAFDCYYKPLYAYGMKLCGQRETVEDAVQDIFENLWTRCRELEHITSPNVYLFVSLRRKIMKEMKQQRRKTNDLDELPEDGFTCFGVEEIIIRDEVKFRQKQKLHQALGQLTGRQREVLYLRYYNGLSYSEIRQILSISRKSAYNHMHRALETLRSLLDIEIMKLVNSLLVIILFLGSLWG